MPRDLQAAPLTAGAVHALYEIKRQERSKKPVALVIGASRGIGRQVAIDLAKNGYAVVVAAKSTLDASSTSPFPPNPNSSASTISTVERDIREAGGSTVAISVDTRSPPSINSLFAIVTTFYGHIDQVNVEGLYAVVQAALPYFEKQGWKGRIIVVSPPIYSRFFRGKTGYTIGKEREGKKDMAIASIWPAVAIESAATQNFEGENRQDLRKPTIYGRDSGGWKDEDFEKYNVVPGSKPRRIMPKELPDLTVAEQDDQGKKVDGTKLRATEI
ncbi:hypothetical protein E8E11_005077 [Didymella keratinophila]|nr:hypothetical protein E8E11_005077 [Didymella keratinophila]